MSCSFYEFISLLTELRTPSKDLTRLNLAGIALLIKQATSQSITLTETHINPAIYSEIEKNCSVLLPKDRYAFDANILN